MAHGHLENREGDRKDPRKLMGRMNYRCNKEISRNHAQELEEWWGPDAIYTPFWIFFVAYVSFLGVLSVLVCKISEAFGWHDHFG